MRDLKSGGADADSILFGADFPNKANGPKTRATSLRGSAAAILGAIKGLSIQCINIRRLFAPLLQSKPTDASRQGACSNPLGSVNFNAQRPFREQQTADLLPGEILYCLAYGSGDPARRKRYRPRIDNQLRGPRPCPFEPLYAARRLSRLGAASTLSKIG
jgi:hypothetical protein